jgi:hypothetical protein
MTATSSAPATMTSVPAASSAPSTAALALRTCFIYNQRAAHKIFAVQRLNRFFRLRVIADLRESESAGLPGEAIAKKRQLIGLHSDFRKQSRYLLFCSLERQIPHVQFLHGRSPYVQSQRQHKKYEAEETGSSAAGG